MYKRILSISMACAMVFTLLAAITPAKAFDLKLPKILQSALDAFSANKTYAQDAGSMVAPPNTPPPGDGQIMPPPQPPTNQPPMQPPLQPGDSIFCNSLNRQSTASECSAADALRNNTQPTQLPNNPPPSQPGGTFFCYSLNRQATASECDAADASKNQQPTQPPINQPPIYQPQPPMNQPPMPQPPTCNVNGTEMSGPCNNYPPQGGQGTMPPQMGPGGQQGQMGGGGNFLKDMQRGVKQMANQIKKFETWMASAIKKGVVIPQEITDKLTEAKAAIEKINSAQSSEDLQNSDFDPSVLSDATQTLEQYRQEQQQQEQMLKGMQRGMKEMMRGFKMYASQIAKLEKKKTVIPADIKDTVAKATAIFDAVQKAKTYDEAEAAGIEDLQDIMMNLNDGGQQLEMLARWPQVTKQMDSQLKILNSQLKKDKSIVTRLTAKGIDVSAAFTAFEEGVNKLQTARNDAVTKMQAGDSQGAFDAVESDFFGQMDDVMQNQQTIDLMNNLGNVNSQLQKSLNDAQRVINTLKRKKVDTTELVDLLNQAKTKASEIKASLKAKPIDTDNIQTALEDMQNIKQEFDDKAEELGGDTTQPMPWEQGTKQFQTLQMPVGMNQYLPQQQTNPMGESNPQPSPGPSMGY